MTATAINTAPSAIANTLKQKPPALNERVYLRAYGIEEVGIGRTIRNHAEIVEKCGLVPEIVTGNNLTMHLYAARRRNRNKHD